MLNLEAGGACFGSWVEQIWVNAHLKKEVEGLASLYYAQYVPAGAYPVIT